MSWQGRSWPQQSHSMEDEYRRNLREREEARDEAERQLRDVQNQLRQERARSKLREEAQEREKTSWGSQEEAFKKRIAQLEWNTEMYAVATREKEAKDRELKEWKEAFDELEKERDEAVRKAHQCERDEIKKESDAVQNFVGKVLEENEVLQDRVREMPVVQRLQKQMAEAEVDRDIFKKETKLYKEFFDFVRINNCLNHQGHAQWGITSYKIKCVESSREARIERVVERSTERGRTLTSQQPDRDHPNLVQQTRPLRRVRSLADTAPARDDRHSYIPRTGSENELLLRSPTRTGGLPPRNKSAIAKPEKKTSPTKESGIAILVRRMEDAEGKAKRAEEALGKERDRYRELEMRWKAVSSKKDKDLADARHKIAALQVEGITRPPSASSTVELDDSLSTIGKETSSCSQQASFSETEKAPDVKHLLMKIETYKQECVLLSDELAVEKEAHRKLDFARSLDDDQHRSALIELQASHEETIRIMQKSFDDEKAVIWNQHEDSLRSLGVCGKNLEQIQSTFAKVLEALNLILDLSSDGNDGRQSAQLTLAKPRVSCMPSGEEIARDIISVMEQLSSLLAARCSTLPATTSGGTSRVSSTPSNHQEAEDVAEVTVKLNWLPTQNGDILHAGMKTPDFKGSRNLRREIEQVQSREQELLKVVEGKNAEIAKLYEDLEAQDAVNVDLQQRLASCDTDRRVERTENPEGIAAEETSTSPDVSATLSPLEAKRMGAGQGLCKKCLREMTASDVESALDMAIALGHVEQQLGDREAMIAQLENKILELEDEVNEKGRGPTVDDRCWEVESKFNTLATMGTGTQMQEKSAFSTRMLESLKYLVKRHCDSIIFELANISQDLGRSCAETLEIMKFSHLQSLGNALAHEGVGLSPQEPMSAGKDELVVRRRLEGQLTGGLEKIAKPTSDKPKEEEVERIDVKPEAAHLCTTETQPAGAHTDTIDRSPESPGLSAAMYECVFKCGFIGSYSEVLLHEKQCKIPALRGGEDASERRSAGQDFSKRRWFGGWFGRSSPKDPGGSDNTDSVCSGSQEPSPSSNLSEVETQCRGGEENAKCLSTEEESIPNQPDTSSTGLESDVQPGVVAELSSLLQSQAANPQDKPIGIQASMVQNDKALLHKEVVGLDASDKSKIGQILVTVQSAKIATEQVFNPYIVLTLESKGKGSRGEVSRKTCAGGKQMQKDHEGKTEVEWAEEFEFALERSDQKLTFAWFDCENGNASSRPTMLGYGKMPTTRIFGKLDGSGSSAPYVLSLSNQVCILFILISRGMGHSGCHGLLTFDAGCRKTRPWVRSPSQSLFSPSYTAMRGGVEDKVDCMMQARDPVRGYFSSLS